VGVAAGADRPWRYWLAGEPTVSGYRRHPAHRRDAMAKSTSSISAVP
jgi:DNA-3-methyladenine glycosylase